MAGRDVFQLTAAAPSIERNLGFIAHSVIVDNYTPSFVRVPGSVRDVPPFSFGVVLSLDGTDLAKASLISTSPAPTGPPVPSAQATLTFLSERLPSSAGHLLQASQYSQQRVIGSVTAPGGGGVVSQSFPLPAGSVSVGYAQDFVVSPGTPTTVEIDGDQSGDIYRHDAVIGLPPVHASLLNPKDTSVTLKVTPDAVQNSTIDLIVWTVPVTSTVTPDVSIPFPVTFSSAGTTATNAPWQSPNFQVVGAVLTTAGVYKQILAPVGVGVRLYFFYARIDLDAVSGGVFALGFDGLVAGLFSINDNGKGPYIIGPFTGGIPLNTNSGLFVFTSNAVTVRFTCAVSAF